ncbi:hypothetical protein [Deinococcus maricopensis]|uniref:Uncharacterized protein n=1 Tax=Deinococcus maricopensis (strain DSM 21211 / LMG 22137 / NRRL B-23946 / LB-34) TaxID=709986 RepID=E8U553_DEIML|nr:hypothetical protein [Deinococcus maricopensis]ADV66192.1 hypothetical protein Deima_0533 [Deinococcus maricopensis DSM 21211]
MTDETKQQNLPDPADKEQAEGDRQDTPTQDQGQSPHVDPAMNREPAEGGRDEVEGQNG